MGKNYFFVCYEIFLNRQKTAVKKVHKKEPSFSHKEKNKKCFVGFCTSPTSTFHLAVSSIVIRFQFFVCLRRILPNVHTQKDKNVTSCKEQTKRFSHCKKNINIFLFLWLWTPLLHFLSHAATKLKLGHACGGKDVEIRYVSIATQDGQEFAKMPSSDTSLR